MRAQARLWPSVSSLLNRARPPPFLVFDLADGTAAAEPCVAHVALGNCSMMRWEYRKIDLNDVPRRVDDIDVLSGAGKDGWELVSVTRNNIAYLKRQIEDPAAPSPARRRVASARASDA